MWYTYHFAIEKEHPRLQLLKIKVVHIPLWKLSTVLKHGFRGVTFLNNLKVENNVAVFEGIHTTLHSNYGAARSRIAACQCGTCTTFESVQLDYISKAAILSDVTLCVWYTYHFAIEKEHPRLQLLKVEKM